MRDRGFFPMPSGDLFTVVLLLGVAAVLFAPWTRNSSPSGLVLFGWLMGLYMVAAPIYGLAQLLIKRRG